MDDFEHPHQVNTFENGHQRYRGEVATNDPDVMDGIGQLLKAQQLYEGEFKQDKMYGFGRIIYKDGSFYVGNIASSKRHGAGILTKADGQVVNATWVRDSVDCDGEISPARVQPKVKVLNYTKTESLVPLLSELQNTSLGPESFFENSNPKVC